MSDKSPKPEQAKQASRRIVLDHYQQLTDLDRGRARWKFLGVVLGAAALVTVIGSLLANYGCVNEWSAPAQVASVHSSWEKDCQVCHTPGLPLRADSFAVRTLVGFKDDLTERENDKKCMHCHAGPQHHKSQKLEETPSCAACHIDHQGVNGDLLRFSDTQCTKCHANIVQHLAGAAASDFKNVTGFHSPSGHPEFRSLSWVPQPLSPSDKDQTHAEIAFGGVAIAARPLDVEDHDRGNLKFNHALHLAPNPQLIRKPGQDEESREQLADSNVDDYARYRRNATGDPSTKAPVQLVCADCHEPENPKLTSKGRGLPTEGAYMLPINFERHCAACHKLPLWSAQREKNPLPEAAAERVLSKERHVPHGLQPGEMAAFFNGVAAELAGETPPGGQAPSPIFPGKPFGKGEASEALKNPLAAMQASRAFVEKKCQQCHYERQAEENVPAGGYWPTLINSVWFTHARFDHSAHRAVRCEECHSLNRDPDARHWTLLQPGDKSKAALDDLEASIPKLETCVRCHAPRGGDGSRGGARFDCAECHRYHAGEIDPSGRLTPDGKTIPHGAGVPARRPSAPFSFDAFLKGKPLPPSAGAAP